MSETLVQELVHLKSEDVSLLLRLEVGRPPAVLYWGSQLGELSKTVLAAIARSLAPQRLAGDIDEPRLVGIVPLASDGWAGTPAVEGHRDGRDFSSLFLVESWSRPGGNCASNAVHVLCADLDSGLRLTLDFEITRSGLVRSRIGLQNLASGIYTLDRAELGLPVPSVADEVFDLTGRWAHERIPQRHLLTHGRYERASRKGRPGADAAVLLAVGERGFGFRSGQVWALHVAWSGNSRLSIERSPRGETVLSGGELLLAGQVRLDAGDTYLGPWVYASWGDGLDAISRRFHEYLRTGRADRDRPVVLNTWEAFYFDHSLDKHLILAEIAAGIGVERYVLDDGWFSGRRSDTSSLGDWNVDEEIWPEGLLPLATRVRELGMDFGLWVEPEMVSVESQLAAAHPEWLLGPGGRSALESRQQQVLNLAEPEAFAHVLSQLDALISALGIVYLKWDHNRDLLEPGSPTTGRSVPHEQTLAVYALMDELRDRHPSLEIENCASGAARLDLAMLERTVRIWPSDCIDPLERARIQQFSGLIAPMEMIGAHIGSNRSHTTGRWADIDFAGGIALLGSLGVEYDLTTASEADLERIRLWIDLYKKERGFLRSGVAVNVDDADQSLMVRGVISPAKDRALYSIAQLVTSVAPSAGLVRFPGLDDDALYRVAPLAPGDAARGPALSRPPWLSDPDLVVPGRVLAAIGLPAPVMFPEQVLLVSIQRVGRPACGPSPHGRMAT